MDIKNFCNAHWSSEPHGEEPTRKDSGDRDVVFAPEGEACAFCAEPATHAAPYTAPPAPEVPKDAGERRPSRRP